MSQNISNAEKRCETCKRTVETEGGYCKDCLSEKSDNYIEDNTLKEDGYNIIWHNRQEEGDPKHSGDYLVTTKNGSMFLAKFWKGLDENEWTAAGKIRGCIEAWAYAPEKYRTGTPYGIGDNTNAFISGQEIRHWWEDFVAQHYMAEGKDKVSQDDIMDLIGVSFKTKFGHIMNI